MDRKKLLNSYAGISSSMQYDAYERSNAYYRKKNEEQLKPKAKKTNKNLANEQEKLEVLREENVELEKQKLDNSNFSWEPNKNISSTISRVDSTADNRKTKNSFVDFLELQRKDLYENQEDPFFVKLAQMKNDPNAQKYLEFTDKKRAKDIAKNMDMMSAKEYVANSKPDDYDVSDWVVDAYRTFRIAQNQAQADDYKGQIIRSQELDDKVREVMEYSDKQLQLEAIENYRNAVDVYYNALKDKSEMSNRIKESAATNLNNSINDLKKYYGKNFNPFQIEEDDLIIKQDRTKLKNDVDFYHGDYDLKDYANVHGDAMSFATKSVLNALGLGRLGRDDVENDAYETLRNLDTKDPRKRKIQLQNFLERSKKTRKTLAEKLKYEEIERDEIKKPSEYFSNKVQLGSQRIQNGESWWNKDNLFYSQVQQQGFSNSSWLAQGASMVLNGLGSAANDTGVGAIVGVPMLVAGAGFQYEAGRAENNAEVIENVKKRLKFALNNGFNNGVNLYNNIIKNTKKLPKYKDKTEDEILEAIATGQLHVTSKASETIAQVINDEIIQARKGSNALFDKDMAAVASDAATDALIWGTGGVAKLGSVTGKGLTWTGNKLAQSRIGGKLLGAAEKTLNESAKYRLAKRTVKKGAKNVKDFGKYIWARGGDLSTYESILGQAGYGVGLAAKTVISGLEKGVEKLGKTQFGHKLYTSPFVTNTAIAAEESLNFVKNIPQALLKKSSKKISDVTGADQFVTEQFIKRQASKIGNIVPSTFSEQIEEGKQYLNANEWIVDKDPKLVENTLNITLSDLEKQLKLIPAALGVPFGMRWGLAKDSELFENMSGGMLGGFAHSVITQSVKDLAGEIGEGLGWSTGRATIDKIISTNAYLDNKSTIGRLETAQLISKKIGGTNYGKVLEELSAFLEFNDQQRKNGYDAVDQEMIDEQRNFISKVNLNYQSDDTKKQAETNGIKVGSEDYNKFVAAKTIYQEERQQAVDNYNQALSQLNNLLTESVNATLQEDILSESIFGDEDSSNSENPILNLFKDENTEDLVEKTMTRRERKAAKREKNKANRSEKRRQRLIEKGESNEIADEILETTVGATQKTNKEDPVLSKKEKVKIGSAIITELIGLTKYIEAIDNASSFSKTNNKHDVEYIKQLIQKRIDVLKLTLPEEKIKHILENQQMYLDSIDNSEELVDAYQTRIATSIDIDSADLMMRMLTGVGVAERNESGDFIKDGFGRIKKLWGISNAKDVLKKILETIDDKYELMDRVNQEFENRNEKPTEDVEQSIRQAAEDNEIDQMLSTDEELQTQDPEKYNEPDVVNQDIESGEYVPEIDSIESDIQQQERDAVRAAIDAERQKIRDSYDKKISEETGAKVVHSEEEMVNTKAKKGDKIAVVENQSKNYNVYTVESEGNIVDEDGIYVVRNGEIIPQDLRKRSEEQLGKQLTQAQQNILDELNLKIDDDNSKIIGVTGHYYFIKDENGQTIMYPRVHTIKGDLYEDAPEMDKNWSESSYNLNLNKIKLLIADNDIDLLKQLISNINNYQLYLDQLKNNFSTDQVAKALAEELTKSKPGVGVNVGQVGDELARIFFDSSNSQSFEYETLKINVGFDDNTYNISELMSKEAFERTKQDLIILLKKYDELGYVISTKRHTWFGTIYVNGKQTRIAGETDLIAVDREGKIHIIDTKTTKYSFKEDSAYFTKLRLLYGRNAKRTTKEDYALLLSYYMALIKSSMPNIQFSENPLELLPLIVNYNTSKMQLAILILSKGEHVLESEKPIDEISNNRNYEPQRISLTPVDEIINGKFDDESDVELKKQNVEDRTNSIKELISVFENEVEDKQKQLAEHHNSLSNILQNITSAIKELLNNIININKNISDENIDGAQLDEYISQLNDIENKLEDLKNKTANIYSKNITKIFEEPKLELKNEVKLNESDSKIIPNVPSIPTSTYSDDKDGWYNYNTADRDNVNSIVSDDADKIHLNTVTGNENFATNSKTIINKIIQEKGNYIILCDIEYDGHIFKNVRIQVAQNAKGQALLSSAQQALAMRQEGEIVALGGMDRTAGIVNVVPEMPITSSSAIMEGKEIYDISTEHTQKTFGLAKMNKSGLVEVHSQGAAPGTTSIIYVFQKGQGTPGAYYTIIKPQHHNSTVPTKPLAMPMMGSKLEKGDIELLIELLSTVARYNNPDNYYEYSDAGKSFNIPLTYKDLIGMFLPYGIVDSRDKARHVRVESNKVIFTEYASNGTNVIETVFDLNNQKSIQDLQQYISFKLRFDMLQNRINSRLGESNNDKHPFKKMAVLFERKPDLQTIKLGNSRITFNRSDFIRPDGNKDGISGLGWMARNGLVTTNYGGINNPRFSYTEVLTTKLQKTEKQQIELEPEITPEDFDSIDDVDELFDDGVWAHVQTTQNPDRKIKNAEQKLHKMFGYRIKVLIAAKLSNIFHDVNIPAGAVGAMIRGAIGLQTNAERGTEFHEAFHLVSRMLLPKYMRNKLYKYIEKIILRDEPSGRLEELIEQAKQEAPQSVNPKEYALEEYGAELCRNYFNTIEDVDFSVSKIFDYIKENGKALRDVGDYRLATLFIAMRFRAFSLPGLRLSSSQSKQSEAWMSQAVYKRNGVSYKHILNDVMYDQLIRSITYYIFRSQNVRPDGGRLEGLDISKENLQKRHVFLDSKTGKPKIGKDGKPLVFSTKEIILLSCMTRKDGKFVDTPTSLAVREMFDNFDQTYDNLKRYMDEIGVDYHQKEEQKREDAMVSGEENEAGSGNTDHNYDKASYEVSRITKATTGIKFYTSLIRAYGTISDLLDEKGKPIIDEATGLPKKTIKYQKNNLGLYEFIDSKEVLVTLLNKLHGVKSKKQMLQKINDLAQSDPIFYQLRDMLLSKESRLKKKDGSINYSNELILTQFFNLMASSKNHFMRVQAKRDRQTNTYNLSVEECGLGYEASQYRMEWGRLLTYGGTTLFERNEDGIIIPKTIGSHDGVEVLGSIFDKISEIRNEFSQYRIDLLKDHDKPQLFLKNPKTGKSEACNVITEDGCNRVIDYLCSMFNYIGIQFDSPEFRYMLQEKYGSKGFNTVLSQLQQFFQAEKKESIEQLYGSERKIIVKDPNGKWRLNTKSGENIIMANRSKDEIPVENIFTNNSFASELSEWKYKYQHSTTDLSVLIGNGKTYYEISENSTITDITDELSTGGQIIEDLSKFCYNYVNISGKDAEGNEVTHSIGSLLLKRAILAKENGVELPIQINTLTQFKTDNSDDEGSGYFEISEREDYVAKCSILEQCGLIFPTMSDKKTWVYISGLDNMPGFKYSGDTITGYGSDDVLKLLMEYAELERLCINQTIQQLKNIPENQKVTNFHKGSSIRDIHGVNHNVANGTVFGSFTGIYINGKFESFSDQLDSNGEFITPEKNIEKANRLFFSKSELEKLAILKETLNHQVQKELDHIEKLGLISKTSFGSYENKGLNDAALSAIAKVKFNLKPGEQLNKYHKNACVRDYIEDIVSKSIISIHEVERCYSGHPGFFKYKFDKQGRLVNRKDDEFKRFGGLISTGTNNNIDIEDSPADNKYTCAVVDNEMIQSPELDFIIEKIENSEWKAALRQLRMKDVWNPTERKNIWKQISKMSLQDVKNELKLENETVYNIIAEKVKNETDSYRKDDKGNKGIDVADGGAYISPQMTKWLLLMCGEYDNRVNKAFKILMNSDKYDAVSVSDAYSLVATKVIGAQKYTAYGQRLSADGKTMIPYYNKMALFPVFKCMATGKFAKIYDQMINNKNEDGSANPIHMLMVQSAVKLGDEGSVTYNTSSDFQGFHTYKQDFKFLRKLFNTNPHHKEDQSMGTQMVKVALTSLIADKDYVYPNGKIVSGELILENIMSSINKLTAIGQSEFREKIYGKDDKIDPKKLSELLIEQLSSRDADISMIEALLAIPITDGENNTIGWKLKHPLAAISRMGWLQSVLKSVIDKKMVEIHTYGNAFYQRSIWGMEGHGADYISDENIAEDINDGKELQMIVKEGPGKNSMECVLTMDYFDQLFDGTDLEKASFSEKKKALIDAKIIGPEADANLIGYRIPTQAQSSIHSLVCRDVLPVLNHNIILPKEFTKITGSDFDIDKIFIASYNYKLRKNTNTNTYYAETSTLDEKKQEQNKLLESYVTLLSDEEGMHIANRSIDNDTKLITDVLEDLERNENNNGKYEPINPYDFYTLSNHTNTKLNFLTGKIGIGPFALNNNSQILTMLYGVEFSNKSFMSKIGAKSLHEQSDMDGQSIMSWISALINAHVDIAKDPYISRLNVNQMTYNLVNLLIRTGFGKRTFWFTKLPAMLKMSEKYIQAQGSFLQDTERSKWDIKNEAKIDGIVELVGKPIFDQITKFLNVNDKKPEGDIAKFAKDLLRNEVLHKIASGEIKLNSTQTYKVGGYNFTPAQIQVLVYYTDKALEKPALAMSDLVKYSKIDTKKQGKNISEQLSYIRGVAKIFNDPTLLEDLFGKADISKITDMKGSLTIEEEIDYLQRLLSEETDFDRIEDLKGQIAELLYESGKITENDESEFEKEGLRNMYLNSFIKSKTKIAIHEFMGVMDGLAFEATPGFQNLVVRLCDYFNKYDSNSISNITLALCSKLKAEAINAYADEIGINIHSLVSGNNTIYDRLNSIKIRLKSDPEYSDITNNPLLNMLIADKHWQYRPSSHPGNVVDRFDNLKFIRLFDAMDKSSAKTDYIISAWNELLQNGNHPEIREFARDLCVYAFVTSGDKSGRTKLFNYVPNSFREESKYVNRIEQMLLDINSDEEWGYKMFTDELIDDLVLNNQNISTFVKTINISDSKLKEGKTKWLPIIMNSTVTVGGGKYKPSYPIFITTDVTTPAKIDELAPFIKVSHMKKNLNDNSSRAESIYKLVGFVPHERGTGYPVYVKVNSKGYHIDGGYDFYEYGRDISDSEYVPTVSNIKQITVDIIERKDAYENKYGKGFATVAEILNSSTESVGFKQSQNNQTPNYQRVIETSDKRPVVRQEDEKENIYSTRKEMLNAMFANGDAFIGEVSRSPYIKREDSFVLKTNTEVEKLLNSFSNRGVPKSRMSDLLSEEDISYLTENNDQTAYYNVGYESGGNTVMAVTNRELFDLRYVPKTIAYLRDPDRYNEDVISTQVSSFKNTSTFLIDINDKKAIEFFLKNEYKYEIYQVNSTSNSPLNNSSQEVNLSDNNSNITIEYTPTGKNRLIYTIKGSHVYNKEGKEVFKESSVDRTRIFANLAIKLGRAVVIEYKGSKYVVNNKNAIVSVQTGKIMQWGEENGDRNNILIMAKPKLENVAKLMKENNKANSNENLKC